MGQLDPLPALHAYWDRPAKKEKGHAESAPLFINIGLALTAWESVEIHFARLFSIFVESKSQAASRAYGSILSGNGRREALTSAAEVFFFQKSAPKEEQDHFELLQRHLAKALPRRNEIAHGIVISLSVRIEGKDTTSEQSLGIFLCSPDYNSSKTQFMNKNPAKTHVELFKTDYCYVAEDISHFIARFELLKKWASSFSEYLSGKYP